MLLVASDDRSSLSYQQRKAHLGYEDYGQHTDTMMLVHLSGDGQNITVVSLPRDTKATIPAWTDKDGKHNTTTGKLNVAYAVGSPSSWSRPCRT